MKVIKILHKRIRRGAWILEQKEAKKKIKKTKKARTKRLSVERKENQSIKKREKIENKTIESVKNVEKNETLNLEEIFPNEFEQIQFERQLKDVISYLKNLKKPIIYEEVRKYIPLTKDKWEHIKENNKIIFE